MTVSERLEVGLRGDVQFPLFATCEQSTVQYLMTQSSRDVDLEEVPEEEEAQYGGDVHDDNY